MIKLDVLNVLMGEAKIYIKEEDEQDRKKLAELVQKMIRSGHAVFLLKSGAKEGSVEKDVEYRIHDYDPKTNEWIVYLSEPQKGKKRVLAKGTKAMSVAPAAGG